VDRSEIGRRADVFALSWVAYASFYLCRKQLAVTKSHLAHSFHLSLGTLGAVETAYLMAYAAGLFASGLVCDAVGARRLVGIGMLTVAGATVSFGCGSTAAVFAISFALNGLAQSTGWPGTVKVMTAWIEPAERGRIMGRWSTCYQLGGLAATAAATWLLTHHGWRSAFIAPAAWTAAVGLVVLRFLREHPTGRHPAPTSLQPVARRVLREPLLWNLGAAYFCLKLIRYTLLFWVPFYLTRELHYDEGSAGYLSLSFELGGAFGTIACGALSDTFRQARGRVALVLVLGLAAALWIYRETGTIGPVVNFCGMALVGFMLFGPDALICSVAAQDLGGRGAAGTAAGFINGVGSIGALMQGLMTAAIVSRHGWPALFRVLFGLATLAAVLLVPYAAARRRAA
jgi:OPA family sugar phosphate sensor protein UhpC-like MFS transporter